MSLCEEFDEPGRRTMDYERLSSTGLGAIVLYRLSQYGTESTSERAAALGHDAFRLTSWVDEGDCLFGSALAISQPDESGDPFVSAHLYKVNRDTRQILPEYPKTIEVPRLITGISDLKGDEVGEWISDMLLYFDRDELMTSINMIAKAANVFHSKRLPAVDKYVYFALAEPEVDELSRRFPGPPLEPDSEITAQNGEKQHITEWSEFMKAADNLIKREANPEHHFSHVNVRCEVEDEMYYIKLVARYGELHGVQILCERDERWKSQLFDIDPDKDEDDADVNIVNGMWDRDAILETLRYGEPVSNGIYEYYRELAQETLTAALQASSNNLVYLPEVDN